METENIADILSEEIYKAIIEEHNRLGLVVTNRALSYDFARTFKETSMDYTVNCVLVERLYLKSACKIEKRTVQRYPAEATELRGKILKIAYDVLQGKLSDDEIKEKLAESKAIEDKLPEFELVDSEAELLTYSPMGLDGDSIVMLDISSDDFSKLQYRSFCNQMAYFAFNYFSAMIMRPATNIPLTVKIVRGTSYIDILCMCGS